MKEAAYKNYLLILLLLIHTFNGVDRLGLGLLLQGIKESFALSDTDLGVLSGIAFALFYSVLGVPIARWADRGNRVTILSLTAAVWSVMVALCGVAGSFLQLLLIRIGVAVGEAGCNPAAYSLIADHFTRAERPRAVARYMLGVPLSVGIAYLVAGWLNEFYGWRTTFVLLGLPGLLLALLAWVTLKEPRLGKPARDASGTHTVLSPAHPDIAAPPLRPSLRDVSATLWSNRSFRHLLLGYSVVFFFASGIAKWQPTFFIRSYGMSTGALGTWFAVMVGVSGIVGMYLGGEWASRSAANDERLQLKVAGIIYSGVGLVSALIYLSPHPYWAFGLLGLAAVIGATIAGPLFATIQTLVPETMRATSIALIFLVANLIGAGLGPLAAGVLSDVLRPWVGEESLRYALLALCPGYLWAGWHLVQASKTVTRDIAGVQREPQVSPDSEMVSVQTGKL